MVTQEATYKRIKRVKDDRFTIDELDLYSLTMIVGIHDLQFAVVDTQDNQCMGMEDYRLVGAKTVNGRLRLIKEILDNHEYLTAGFWKEVKLCLKTHKFTLVPSDFFVPEAQADYLILNSEINSSFEEVANYKHSSAKVVNIYAAESKLYKWIQSIYKKKKVHIIHQGSAFIEGVMGHKEKYSERSMYCFVDRGILHVLVMEEGQVLFYNQFAARNKEDYLKYIMLTFKEMNMSNKSSNVIIWGFMKQNSDEMKLLKKYIRNISYGSKPSTLKFSHQFDEVEDHQYFDVLSGYLCD